MVKDDNQIHNKKEYLLYIYTLGKFEIYNGNEIITEGYKRSNRMWNLFKYIMSNKTRLLSPEELIENLWYNDETESNLQKSLQNLMFRLRRCLFVKEQTEDLILFTQGCYKWNENYSVWIDCEIMADYHRRGVEQLKSSLHEARYCFERAINLYNGEYFNDIFYNSWILAFRIKYQTIYLECVLYLIEILEKLNNHEAIIRICQSAFEIEKLDEKINIAYIKALNALQKNTEALKHYEYITTAMFKELGLKPSEELKNVFRQLTVKNEPHYFDMSSVMEIIEDDKESGAFVCDKNTFFAVNRVILRNLERSGISVMIISVNLIEKKATFKDTKLLKEMIEEAMKVLAVTLRRSDMLSVWDKNQILCMLTNLTYEDAETVIEKSKIRIEENVLKDRYSMTYKILPLEKNI